MQGDLWTVDAGRGFCWPNVSCQQHYDVHYDREREGASTNKAAFECMHRVRDWWLGKGHTVFFILYTLTDIQTTRKISTKYIYEYIYGFVHFLFLWLSRDALLKVKQQCPCMTVAYVVAKPCDEAFVHAWIETLFSYLMLWYIEEKKSCFISRRHCIFNRLSWFIFTRKWHTCKCF